MPLPRREVAVVQRQPHATVLALFRLRGRRRRLQLPDEDRRAELRRGRRAARGEVRRAAAARGGRRPRRAAQGPAAQPADRGEPGRPGLLRRAAGHARRPGGAAVPARARLRPGRRRHVRGRVRSPRRRGGLQAPAPEGLQPGGDGRGRAGRDRPVGVRPLPRAAALADPRRQRRHDRVRRAADLRRRQDRGEVPQHPRDQDLQEEPGALRHRPRPPRHGAVVAGASWSRATPT